LCTSSKKIGNIQTDIPGVGHYDAMQSNKQNGHKFSLIDRGITTLKMQKVNSLDDIELKVGSRCKGLIAFDKQLKRRIG